MMWCSIKSCVRSRLNRIQGRRGCSIGRNQSRWLWESQWTERCGSLFFWGAIPVPGTRDSESVANQRRQTLELGSQVSLLVEVEGREPHVDLEVWIMERGMATAETQGRNLSGMRDILHGGWLKIQVHQIIARGRRAYTHNPSWELHLHSPGPQRQAMASRTRETG
ncbi:hypothetical protein B0H65DRAFT_191075 [Neurospora tetraspora]|uniref:Uncharacterized protein n=1 Tax=Neurospora tetraspora TaxID=94610 RepID=A0AAE0JEN6_9PEZI|nr:hypothetical protein B0H65DRAFT_191075 [Neurospora tetraspora]